MDRGVLDGGYMRIKAAPPHVPTPSPPNGEGGKR